MSSKLPYGSVAKFFHWTIVALLTIQMPLGLLIPRIPRGSPPNAQLNIHISIGFIVLALIVLRLAWRVTHPVAPESALPVWQRLTSEAVHWLLYLAVFATTMTGWAWATFRGYDITLFWTLPLPQLYPSAAATIRAMSRLHETLAWGLVALVGLHVAAAFVHLLVYKDGVMRRMLPGS